MSNSSSQLKRAVTRRPEQPPVLSILAQEDHEELRTIPISTARIRKIAVALDGSLLSELAIPYARRLAMMAGAELKLVHIHESTLTRPTPGYLRTIATRLDDANVRFENSLLLKGSKAAQRFSEAAEGSIDLVVVATRRRSACSRAFWSSLADRLHQSTSVPMLIVRGSIPPSDLHWTPPLRQMLVPLVGPAMQHETLNTVAEIGELTGGIQTVLQILPIPNGSVAREDLEIKLGSNALAEDENDLKCAAASLPRPVTRIVFSNSRLEEVVSFDAIANETDLIALATRARSPLKRWLAPELFDYLLQDTDVPVLVFRPTPEK